MKPKPYQQGALDGLCGVYTLINTLHYLEGPLDDMEAEILFDQLVSQLDRFEGAARHAVEGMGVETVASLLQFVASAYGLRIQRPFYHYKTLTLDDYWRSLQRFLATTEGAVVLCLEGRYDHWTVVRAITKHHLLLFDSDGCQRLARQHCTIRAPRQRRHHRLLPNQTFLIQRGEASVEVVT